jgi:hypothetical protein
MKITGTRLIRILVIVNMLYSLVVRAESINPSDSQSNNRYYDRTCVEKYPDKSSKLFKACQAAELANYATSTKNICQEIKDNYADTISQIQEGCKPTGLSFTQCLEKARSCAESQNSGAPSLAGLVGGGASAGPCSTKEKADSNQSIQQQQQQDLKDTQKDISGKYDEAQQALQSSMSAELSTLLAISQKNKDIRDLKLDTGNGAQAIDREMRRKLIQSLQDYHQGQSDVAKLNREIVSLSAKLGDLPKNYYDDCTKSAKSNQKQATRGLQQLSESLNSGLKEVSTGNSMTISAYTNEKNSATKKYNEAKSNALQDMKDNYQECLSQKQKAFKVEYEALKSEIDGRQDDLKTLQEKVSAAQITMQEDLRESQQGKTYSIDKANRDLTAKAEEINIVRMQHNAELNAAVQRVQSVQAEMAQYQTDAQSKSKMNMLSGVMGLLTSSGAAGLGDVVPYVEAYDSYQQQLKDTEGCTGKSTNDRIASRRNNSSGQN